MAIGELGFDYIDKLVIISTNWPLKCIILLFTYTIACRREKTLQKIMHHKIRLNGFKKKGVEAYIILGWSSGGGLFLEHFNGGA